MSIPSLMKSLIKITIHCPKKAPRAGPAITIHLMVIWWGRHKYFRPPGTQIVRPLRSEKAGETRFPGQAWIRQIRICVPGGSKILVSPPTYHHQMPVLLPIQSAFLKFVAPFLT